jgi:hypothetical protein
MTTIDDQIAAVRRYAADVSYPIILTDERVGHMAALCAALTTLEQHKLALAVVEAARAMIATWRRPVAPAYGMNMIESNLYEALAALDAGEKLR